MATAQSMVSLTLNKIIYQPNYLHDSFQVSLYISFC